MCNSLLTPSFFTINRSKSRQLGILTVLSPRQGTKTEQATIFSEFFDGYVPDDTDVLTALLPRELNYIKKY
jgi:hypothetical protein